MNWRNLGIRSSWAQIIFLSANLVASGALSDDFGDRMGNNITAAWAVDREFVIYSFLGVVGPMVPPGSPDALGEQKH